MVRYVIAVNAFPGTAIVTAVDDVANENVVAVDAVTGDAVIAVSEVVAIH